MDDPQLAILLVVIPQRESVRQPDGGSGVKAILEETLRYLNVETNYSDEELEQIQSNMTTVPNLVGELQRSYRHLGADLVYQVSPARTGDEDFTIVDQYPKAGER